MNKYTFNWEAEDGMACVEITAETYQLALTKLEQMFPEDIGADGWCDLPNGDERDIGW